MEDRSRWIHIGRDYMAMNIPDDVSDEIVETIKKMASMAKTISKSQDLKEKETLTKEWNRLREWIESSLKLPEGSS